MRSKYINKCNYKKNLACRKIDVTLNLLLTQIKLPSDPYFGRRGKPMNLPLSSHSKQILFFLEREDKHAESRHGIVPRLPSRR